MLEAERAALVRAVSEFGPKIRIEAVAVANLNGAASVAAVPTPQTGNLSYDGLFVRGEFRF